jgi:hypothetical protein
MSYGNVLHPQAVWIARGYALVRFIPKLAIMAVGAAIISAGITYGSVGATIIGATYCAATLLLLLLK